MNSTKTINQLIDDMLSERDCNDDTIKTYRRKLHLWVNWMVQNGNLQDPSTSQLVAYKKYLIDSGHTPKTIDGYMAVLKIMFRWLSTKQIYDDISRDIKWANETSNTVKGYLSPDQVAKLLSLMPLDNEIQFRNYAIVNLMLCIGARCIEVVRLDRSDVKHLNDKYHICLQRKGSISKTSNIEISKYIYAPIDSYMSHQFFAPITEALFQSAGTKPGRRLTTKTIGRIAVDAMKLIGVEGKEYTAHSFRHTAAMCAYKAGAPVEWIQQMLGHKSIATTQHYLRGLQQDNKEATKAISMIEKAYQMSLNMC